MVSYYRNTQWFNLMCKLWKKKRKLRVIIFFFILHKTLSGWTLPRTCSSGSYVHWTALFMLLLLFPLSSQWWTVNIVNSYPAVLPVWWTWVGIDSWKSLYWCCDWSCFWVTFRLPWHFFCWTFLLLKSIPTFLIVGTHCEANVATLSPSCYCWYTYHASNS
jgi:hypothetical protein